MVDTIKHLDNHTTVDLATSRKVWDNGINGDARLELWADIDNVHVWLETNGDPVYGEDSLREALIAEGLASDLAEQIIDGDLSGIEQDGGPQRA